MTKTLSLEDFMSYITTLSGYQEYLKINPGSQLLHKYEARWDLGATDTHNYLW